jgi:hypothetical protein
MDNIKVLIENLLFLANPQQNPPRLAAGMNAFLNRGGYKGERSLPLILHRPLW